MLLKGLTRPMIATLLDIGHPEANHQDESRESPVISDHRVQGSIRTALERAMRDDEPILVTLSAAQADELLAWCKERHAAALTANPPNESHMAALATTVNALREAQV